MPVITKNKLRKNSKKKSSYASNKIEGNPLSEKQADEVIERDEHKKRLLEFAPIDVSKMLGVTNKTVINRCTKLAKNGFWVPNMVNQRIRTYSLSDFLKKNEKNIILMIEGYDI